MELEFRYSITISVPSRKKLEVKDLIEKYRAAIIFSNILEAQKIPEWCGEVAPESALVCSLSPGHDAVHVALGADFKALDIWET